MIKIVINNEWGGFGLSHAALEEYKNRAGIIEPDFWEGDIPRDCPHLVAMVEEQGTAINSSYSYLKVVEIPEDVNWYIEEYDGKEWVAERHRTWS